LKQSQINPFLFSMKRALR